MDPWQFGSLNDQQQRYVLARMSMHQRATLYRQLQALRLHGLAGDDEDGLGSWLSSALKNVKGFIGPLAAAGASLIPGIGPVVGPIVGAALTQRPQAQAAMQPMVVQQAAPPQQAGMSQTTMMLLIGIGALLLLRR